MNITLLIDSIDDPETKSLATELAAREWEPDQIDSETEARVKLIGEAGRRKIRDRLKSDLAEAEASEDHARAKQLIDELKLHGLGD